MVFIGIFVHYFFFPNHNFFHLIVLCNFFNFELGYILILMVWMFFSVINFEIAIWIWVWLLPSIWFPSLLLWIWFVVLFYLKQSWIWFWGRNAACSVWGQWWVHLNGAVKRRWKSGRRQWRGWRRRRKNRKDRRCLWVVMGVSRRSRRRWWKSGRRRGGL